MGTGCERIVDGEDAAADAVAGFEADDAQAGAFQVAGGGESGGTGSDDDDVGVGRRHTAMRAGSHFTLWSLVTARFSAGESMRKYDQGPGIHG